MLCPEHPKRDQNPKFTPLSETTSISVCFIWESPSPPGGMFCSCIKEDPSDQLHCNSQGKRVSHSTWVFRCSLPLRARNITRSFLLVSVASARSVRQPYRTWDPSTNSRNRKCTSLGKVDPRTCWRQYRGFLGKDLLGRSGEWAKFLLGQH